MVLQAFLGLGVLCVLCGARRSQESLEHTRLETEVAGKEGPFGPFGGFDDFGDFGGGGFPGGGFPGGQQPQEPQQPQGFGDFGGFGGGGFPGGGFPNLQPQQPQQPAKTQSGNSMDGFSGGFPGGFPAQTQQTGGSSNGMFPDFDMNGMKDMMGGMMADAMNCMQKENEICCNDMEYRKTVCMPLWYCLIAIGERDFGPVPPCDAPIQFGDASKCKKDEKAIRSDMEMGKSMCFGKIQELYDLQRKLGECVADISDEKKKAEDQKQEMTDFQSQAEDCEKKKAEAKAQQSLGGGGGGSSGNAQFCPAESAALTAAMATYAQAVGKCVSIQLSASVHIPDINIEIPEIKVGVVTEGSFNMDMPDFSAPDFTGDIVVPGGGGKLNVAVHNGHSGSESQASQSHASQSQKLTFDQRKANIQADIKECEETKPKVMEKQKELAATKDEVVKQKQKACEEPSSLLQASPEAQTAIQVFSMMKMVWSCSDVAAAIDAVIAILQRC